MRRFVAESASRRAAQALYDTTKPAHWAGFSSLCDEAAKAPAARVSAIPYDQLTVARNERGLVTVNTIPATLLAGMLLRLTPVENSLSIRHLPLMKKLHGRDALTALQTPVGTVLLTLPS